MVGANRVDLYSGGWDKSHFEGCCPKLDLWGWNIDLTKLPLYWSILQQEPGNGLVIYPEVDWPCPGTNKLGNKTSIT